MQSQVGEFFTNFIQCCFAEVSHFQQLVFGSLNQIPQGSDALRFQAVAGSNRQSQFGYWSVELGFQMSFC
jgi:hypothetical protein